MTTSSLFILAYLAILWQPVISLQTLMCSPVWLSYYLKSFQSNFPAWSRFSELFLPNSQSYSPFSPSADSYYQTKVESHDDERLCLPIRKRPRASYCILLSIIHHPLLASLNHAWRNVFGRELDPLLPALADVSLSLSDLNSLILRHHVPILHEVVYKRLNSRHL